MPKALINGVSLFHEVVGEGMPLIFVHEFAGEFLSWRPQVNFFSRRYRTIACSPPGSPPSPVPADPVASSQQQAVDHIKGLLDHLKSPKAHVCGLSMGG